MGVRSAIAGSLRRRGIGSGRIGRASRCLAIFAVALALGCAATLAQPVPSNAATPGSLYVPFGPTRFVDSRIGRGVVGPIRAFTPVTFAVAGANGLPRDAVAVTGNLTVVDQVSNGWVALTSSPIARPSTSSINIPLGDIRANGVYAPLSATGTLSITTMMTTQVVFDVTGYFSNGRGATWQPLGPTRFLDTRTVGSGGAFRSQAPRSIPIAGVRGVPADAVGVTANVTVVNETTGGYVSITRDPTARPTTSTLNFPLGDIRPNNLTAPLAGDGSLSIVFVGQLPSATTDVVLDVTGYFKNDATGARYVPIAPVRAADSRLNSGLNGPIPSGQPVTLQISGRGLPVPPDARAITGNVAITDERSGGHVSVVPSAVIASTSTLNVPPNDTRANGFVVALNKGTVGLSFVGGGTAQLVVDVTGYFVGGSFAGPAAPAFSGMSMYRDSAWSKQVTNTWCVGASVQMMLNVVDGTSDHSASAQGIYVAHGYSHSRYVARAGTEVDGWANALTAYGAGSYSVVAYPSFDAAIKAAATRMRVTGKPVGLVVMEGHHAWVMAGFTSTGSDPAVSQAFTVTSLTIMASHYAFSSSTYDPAPGYVASLDYLRTKVTPYTDDYPTIWDGRFVLVQP
jgi:hypothetical protein